MAKQRSGVLELTKRGAAVEYRALVDELKLLLDLFPHLRDSYDPDELPVIVHSEAGCRRGRRPDRSTKEARPDPPPAR